MRIGHVGGELVAFPNDAQRKGESRLDLVVAGHLEGICMVEAGAKELPEADMINALELGHRVIREIAELAEELRTKAGKPKMAWTAPVPDADLAAKVESYRPALREVIFTPGKHDRHDAIAKVSDECLQALTAGITDEKALKARTKTVKGLAENLIAQVERDAILDGKRADGRAFDQIREIWISPNFVPRVHGSALFTRGETQALVSVTLGTADDEQIIDGIDDEYRKSFYLHYNFPPYSVGETRRLGGPGRKL